VEEKKKTIPGKTTESWKRKRRRFPAKPWNRGREKEDDSRKNHGIVEEEKKTIPGQTTESSKKKRSRFPAKPRNRGSEKKD
jgi:hypothetical protein